MTALEGFAADGFGRSLAAALRPTREADPVAWIAANVMVVSGPEAGRPWSAARTPFWREPLDKLRPSAPETKIAIRKSAQLGWTTVLIGAAAYLARHAPGPMMLTQATGTDAKEFNRDHLGAVIDASPALRRMYRRQKSRDDTGSSIFFKRFAGGYLALTGANSAPALSRRTIRHMLNDEIDRYPLDLDGQGKPLTMIAARQIAYHRTGDYKQLLGSTPTVDGESAITEEYEAGDQRVYVVPCPHCRHRHTFDFWQLRYNVEAPHNAHYFCPACGVEIRDHHKTWMEAPENGARWEPQNPEGRHPSYHIDAMYSQFTTWDHMVAAYLDAKDDPIALKGFWNLWLGLAFKVQGEAPEAAALFARRAAYAPGTLPPGVLFVTVGVDVQGNRLEAEVVGFGVGKTSWSIERHVIEGDTATAAPWIELGELYRKSWRDWQGNVRHVEAMAIDAGYRPQMVYAFARARNRALAVKGAHGHLAPVLGTPTKQDVLADGQRRIGSVMLWPVGVWNLKAELYGHLNGTVSEAGGFPPGWCHFPTGDLYDLAYFQQLTSEQLIEVRHRRGTISREWVLKRGLRNEALDCRVYATAAAYWMGMGQWTPDFWQRLAAERGAPPAEPQLDLLRALHNPAGNAPPPQKPRTLSVFGKVS